VNLYDWFVCVRKGKVEALWPVTARGAFGKPGQTRFPATARAFS